MKNIVVVSHERSGTHFLMNTIIMNFGRYRTGWADLPRNNKLPNDKQWYYNYRDNIQKFCKKHSVKKSELIFKTHHQTFFFEPFMNEFLNNYTVFYMIRDPRDVAVSCYYYFKKHMDIQDFPHCKSVSELLFKMKPYKYKWDSGRSFIKSENMVERWATHANGWLKYNVNVFRFTELKQDFGDVIVKIRKILGKPLIGRIPKEPAVHFNSVSGRTGREGSWRDHLSRKDNEAVIKIVKERGLERFLAK